MSDSSNLLSPLLDDPLDIINPHQQPHSEAGGKAKSNHRPRKDPGPTSQDEAKSRLPADPAANDEIPDIVSVVPKDAPKSNDKAHPSKTKNRETPPSASTAAIVVSPLIPSTSTKRKNRLKSQTPVTSLPTSSSATTSYSEFTSSSIIASAMPITTTHLATVTSFTYVSSIIASNSPTLVNENVNTSSGGSAGANIAVPVIISVLSGIFLIAMVVFVMSRLKQKRKNRETWSMYREEPWRNPFRESLDQYHSHY
ncbi:hypothetical protein BC943DRAFT_356678 [Umbelopsis sp. AD052]|nr:hypothetical protein BC943DRAFT_356678 [Umbelopsis sp. AD052]